MAVGGVPHYLDKLNKTLSVTQNIDKLCFIKDGLLQDEFNLLYTSLFSNSEKHLSIIKAFADSIKGLNRNELIQKSGLQSGGALSL
jgi:hypothetical protein